MSDALRSRTVFLGVSAGLLGDGYRVRFRAEGQSMHPTIRAGDVITVEPVVSASVRVGNVLLYRAQRGLIAHRVVRIVRERGETMRFILRGDSSCSSDDPVEAAQISGRVVCVARAARSIQLNNRRAKVLQAVRVSISRLKSRVSSGERRAARRALTLLVRWFRVVCHREGSPRRKPRRSPQGNRPTRWHSSFPIDRAGGIFR